MARVIGLEWFEPQRFFNAAPEPLGEKVIWAADAPDVGRAEAFVRHGVVGDMLGQRAVGAERAEEGLSKRDHLPIGSVLPLGCGNGRRLHAQARLLAKPDRVLLSPSGATYTRQLRVLRSQRPDRREELPALRRVEDIRLGVYRIVRLPVLGFHANLSSPFGRLTTVRVKLFAAT